MPFRFGHTLVESSLRLRLRRGGTKRSDALRSRGWCGGEEGAGSLLCGRTGCGGIGYDARK